MACYYTIKLPNGGEVKILATISTITNSKEDKKVYDELTNQVNAYYASKEELTADSSIVKFIKDLKTGLSTNTIKALISNNDASTFIEALNNELLSSGDIANLTYSLRKYLWKKDGIKYIGPKGAEKTISFNELLNAINKPVGKKYFNDINFNGLFGVKSYRELSKDLQLFADNLNDIGIPNSGIKSLSNILSHTKHYMLGNDKVFYSASFNADTNDAVVVFPEESDNPIIVHNGFNDLSLFMGLFKFLGSKVDKEQLLPILEEYNNALKKDSENALDLTDLNVKEFFTGSFSEDEKGNITFNDPQVNKIFRFKANIESTLDKLTDLIVPLIATGETTPAEIKRDFKRLFKYVSPDKLGKVVDLTAKDIAELHSIDNHNKELTNELKGQNILPMIVSEEREYYYSKPIKSQKIVNESDLFHYLTNNVTKGKDLLRVLIKKSDGTTFNRLIVPTEFKMVSNGVKVVGFYEDNGKLVWERKGFIFLNDKEESTVSYRQLMDENPIIYTKNADPLMRSESIVIVAPEGKYLPEDLVQYAAVRGGSITFATKEGAKNTGKFSLTVKGVYPGVIKSNSYENKKTKKVEESNIGTSKVVQMTTDRTRFEDEFTEANLAEKQALLNNLEKVIPSKSFIPVDPGDYIRSREEDKTFVYNKVFGVTDTDVYILIKSKEDNYVIKAIPKGNISTIYKNKVSFDIENIKTIGSFAKKINEDKSIREYGYSAIENYEAAKDGDYLIVTNPDKTYIVYKITNKNREEGIELIIDKNTKELKQRYARLPENLSKYLIVTNRNIYSEHAINIAEINNVHILSEPLENNPENVNYEEVRYFAPPDVVISEYILLNSGNLMVGEFKNLNNLNSVTEGFVDVTEKLSELLDKRNKIKRTKDNPGKKLFVRTKGEGKYYMRYNASLYQTDFTINTNKKDKYLVEHSYVVLKADKDSNISGNKTYRIIGRSGNILTLEYDTFNKNGRLITIQKELNLDIDKDNIKWLYVMKGYEPHKELSELAKTTKIKEVSEKVKTKEEQLKNKKETITSIAQNLSKVYKIKVKIEEHNEKEFKNKKAWIESTVSEDPQVKEKPIVILNITNENSSSVDLVHEYMHLFLMALKYNSTATSINLYENLIKSYKQLFSEREQTNEEKANTILNTNDWSKIEEYLVNDLSEQIDSKGLENIVDYPTFLQAFQEALKNMQLDPLDIDSSNLFSLLNSEMAAIFKNSKSSLSTTGLVLFETNFRNWLTKQINDSKIEIIC